MFGFHKCSVVNMHASLLPFIIWLLLLHFEMSWYILDTSPLSYRCLGNIFDLSLAYLFILLKLSLKEVFNSDDVQFIFFFFLWWNCLDIKTKKSNPRSWRFHVLSKSVKVFCLTRRSIINLELTFIYGMKFTSVNFSLNVDAHVFQNHLLKSLSFLRGIAFISLSKHWPYLCSYTSGPSFFFCWSKDPTLCQFYTVLITVALS